MVERDTLGVSHWEMHTRLLVGHKEKGFVAFIKLENHNIGLFLWLSSLCCFFINLWESTLKIFTEILFIKIL